ncbi:MAG: vitamin K epoxide reductase family protein [Nanoarchaeota archaeon]
MNVWLALLALAGFLISFYIYYTKKNNQQLVCIIGKGCNAVVESKYNTLVGVPNEVIGMLYYALILWSALFALSPTFITIRLFVSGAAALAGLGLLSIQAFVLKKWCEYCIASAIISVSIFVVSWFF